MLKAIGLVLVWLAMVGKLIWLGGLGRERDKGGWFWSFNVFFISTLLDEFIGGCFFKNNFREKNVFFFFVLSSSSCSLNFISIFHESWPLATQAVYVDDWIHFIFPLHIIEGKCDLKLNVFEFYFILWNFSCNWRFKKLEF